MYKALRNRSWFVPAIIALALVSVGGCRKKAPKPTDTTSPDQPHEPDLVPGATPVAMLERTGCYGECPVYRLTVSSDGSVVYVGTRWVKAIGMKQYKISDAQLAELRAAFDRANFAQLHDYDRVENTDDDWVLLSFYRGATPKRVRHYHGDNSAPLALSVLEDEFDRIVGSGRYVGMPSATGSLAPSMSAVGAGPAADTPPPTPGRPAHSAENAGPPDETVADPDNHP
ncbi:MAG: DUF6438 domain-containing protein [Pseudomonadota bacterium]